MEPGLAHHFFLQLIDAVVRNAILDFYICSCVCVCVYEMLFIKASNVFLTIAIHGTILFTSRVIKKTHAIAIPRCRKVSYHCLPMVYKCYNNAGEVPKWVSFYHWPCKAAVYICTVCSGTDTRSWQSMLEFWKKTEKLGGREQKTKVAKVVPTKGSLVPFQQWFFSTLPTVVL